MTRRNKWFQSPKNRVNILKCPLRVVDCVLGYHPFQSPKNRVNILKLGRGVSAVVRGLWFQSPKNRVNILKAARLRRVRRDHSSVSIP